LIGVLTDVAPASTADAHNCDVTDSDNASATPGGQVQH